VDVLGIGIGGSGIKGAPVDLKTGELLEERIRIPTPQAGKFLRTHLSRTPVNNARLDCGRDGHAQHCFYLAGRKRSALNVVPTRSQPRA
jgi:hypothetical protein